MSLINFDCPECDHNLEVDEGGAGFIVKCPECGNPLQIPQLPPSHRIRKIAVAGATLLAILLLFAANLYLASRARALQREAADLRPLGAALQQAQAIAIGQENEIRKLKGELARHAADTSAASLADAARTAIEEAESLSAELEKTSRRFLDNSPGERVAILRAHMTQLVAEAQNGLPAAPVVTEVEPGRGVNGRQIVFPVLPGPDGQILRANAEVTGIDEEKVFVKFPGGTATYALSELHPGVAAFLPVDPLLVLSRKQWAGEVLRVHEMISARRDERVAQLRAAIEDALPATDRSPADAQ